MGFVLFLLLEVCSLLPWQHLSWFKALNLKYRRDYEHRSIGMHVSGIKALVNLVKMNEIISEFPLIKASLRIKFSVSQF